MATLLQTGPQFGVPYVITGPDGERAVFNDPTDADYIGMLSDITGFDSPEVRESADNLVQADGGIHGDFFYGRRPITMSGIIPNVTSPIDRNTKMTKLERATNAMRADATIVWTPDGGETQFLNVRRQQPLRISGGWVKTFQIAMVAADPRIYSYQLYNASVVASGAIVPAGRSYPKTYSYSYGAWSSAILGSLAVTNSGNTASPPLLTITGPGSNPSVTNATTGETLSFFITMGATDTLQVDMLNHTVYFNGYSLYSAVDFNNSDWWYVQPGSNTINLGWSDFSDGASLTVEWRNAWL